MSEPPPDGGFFPLVYDELRRLAAAKLAGEPAGPHARRHGAGARGVPPARRRGVRRPQRVLPRRGRRHAAHPRRPRPPQACRQARRRGPAVRARRRRAIRVADPDSLLDVDAALTRLAAEDPSSADVARSGSSPACRSTRPPRRWASPAPPPSANGPTPARGWPPAAGFGPLDRDACRSRGRGGPIPRPVRREILFVADSRMIAPLRAPRPTHDQPVGDKPWTDRRAFQRSGSNSATRRAGWVQTRSRTSRR